MNFEDELKKGNFVVGECIKCKKTVWPPADYCNKCFGDVLTVNGPSQGKIIEFSKQESDYFCLVQFNNDVRVIGKLGTGIPQINQSVRIEKCGIENGNYFFEFLLI